LARAIASFILSEPRLQLLPRGGLNREDRDPIEHVYIVALFRAQDDALNANLVRNINATRKIYVSGTSWDGKPAARFAISNWQVDIERDMGLIKKVLLDVLQNS
jgi:hypothetical protein